MNSIPRQREKYKDRIGPPEAHEAPPVPSRIYRGLPQWPGAYWFVTDLFPLEGRPHLLRSEVPGNLFSKGRDTFFPEEFMLCHSLKGAGDPRWLFSKADFDLRLHCRYMVAEVPPEMLSFMAARLRTFNDLRRAAMKEAIASGTPYRPSLLMDRK